MAGMRGASMASGHSSAAVSGAAALVPALPQCCLVLPQPHAQPQLLPLLPPAPQQVAPPQHQRQQDSWSTQLLRLADAGGQAGAQPLPGSSDSASKGVAKELALADLLLNLAG